VVAISHEYISSSAFLCWAYIQYQHARKEEDHFAMNPLNVVQYLE